MTFARAVFIAAGMWGIAVLYAWGRIGPADAPRRRFEDVGAHLGLPQVPDGLLGLLFILALLKTRRIWQLTPTCTPRFVEPIVGSHA